MLLPALISDRSDGITPLPRVCAAHGAHVRAARWTFLAHASSKHSPEHHPSSALIDAGQCFTRAAKKLVWKGTATKTLNPSKDPKKNQERLQKAMDKLLKNFPPKDKT